jgi:hypothetical protein
MILTGAWWWLVDDLGAVPGLVVISLTLLTKHVPYIVSIVLLKFVPIHFLCEFTFPKLHRFFHAQTYTF